MVDAAGAGVERFTVAGHGWLAQDKYQKARKMKKIAITGAAGVVGSGLRQPLLRRGYRLLLLDLLPITD